MSLRSFPVIFHCNTGQLIHQGKFISSLAYEYILFQILFSNSAISSCVHCNYSATTFNDNVWAKLSVKKRWFYGALYKYIGTCLPVLILHVLCFTYLCSLEWSDKTPTDLRQCTGSRRIETAATMRFQLVGSTQNLLRNTNTAADTHFTQWKHIPPNN